MRVAFLGNFQPDLPPGVIAWSTETHWAGSFELEGHAVTRIQEGRTRWDDVARVASEHDLFVWVQTYGLAVETGTIPERAEMLRRIRAAGVTSVGLHLDRWWGLNREHQVREEPWFTQDWVFTADGGHQVEFRNAGVNHVWLPPGVYGPECIRGVPRKAFAKDVVFVGSWQGGYHAESKHRSELVEHLREWFPTRLGLWPRNGAVRGAQLNSLYASAKVVVGDSCWVEGDRGFYCSDRIPETLGRGGFLLHPFTTGVTPGLFAPDKHLGCWRRGDWEELRDRIEYFVANEDERERIRQAGHEHVKQNHTYQHRVRTVLETVQLARTLA